MIPVLIILVVLFVACVFIFKLKVIVLLEEEWYIEFYIFKFIRIKRYRINEKEQKKIQDTSKNIAEEQVYKYVNQIEFTDLKLFYENIRELLAKVKFEEINFELNINTKDYILNAYTIAFVNTIVAMLISKNIDRINTDKLNYVITSHESKTKLWLKCIMYDRFTNIIIVLIRAIKFAIELKKRGNDKNGKGTSNRKFNGNSNVIARING